MSPTGVALRDPREQLFAAAERIIAQDGPSALTSRSVTAEAGCAKGVLHRHFADFDAFLVELVGERTVRMRLRFMELNDRVGTGSIVDNLTAALIEVFNPVTLGIVGMVLFRDELRNRLRDTTPVGIPLLTEAADLVVSYLDLEESSLRIDSAADTLILAANLISTGHLRYAGRDTDPPDPESVRTLVTAILGPALLQA